MEALDVSLYEDEDEAKRHAAAIERIASIKGLAAEDVRTVYERMLARMKRQAVIKNFLSVFVARRVERVFDRKRILEGLGSRRSRAV